MRRWLVPWCLPIGLSLAGWVALTSAAAAAASPDTYAHQLLMQVSKTNPELSGAAIIAAAPKSSTSVVVASTEAERAGAAADPADLAVIESGTTATASASGGARRVVRLPLHDVSGDTVGALRLSFAPGGAADGPALAQTAVRIRDHLARRISHAGNLFDPYPYEPDAPSANTRAQQLVDEFLDKYPQIEIMAIHATPPESDYNIIAGSNIGRIGKKADNDDMRCVFTGKPNLEVNSTGKRFESEMQLHDRTGKVIGALGVVFAFKSGADKQALHAQAERIRVELEKRIPDAASLFEPAAGTEADARRKS